MSEQIHEQTSHDADYHYIFNQIDHPSLLIDLASTSILAANPIAESFFGRTLEDLTGTSVLDLFATECSHNLNNLLRRMRRKPWKQNRLPIRYIRPEGASFSLIIQASPLRLKKNDETVVQIDIIEIKRERAKQAPQETVSTTATSRRGLLAFIAAVGAVVVAYLLRRPHYDAAPGYVSPPKNRRMAMYIDLDRCSGCKACVVACKSEHNVPLGAFRSWVLEAELGVYPTVRRYFLPRLCNHCQNPPCVKVCPVGASIKRSDGIVVIDKDRCIGCRYCIAACPFGMRTFTWARYPRDSERWPARKYGTTDKCDFCSQRVDNGLVPSCVNTCPTGARVFGDLNDPGSRIHMLLAENETQSLKSDFGTGPNCFYKSLDSRIASLSIETGNR